MSNSITGLMPSSNTTMRQLVVQTAAQKLFTEKHFSICTLRDIATLTHARQSGPAWDMLHALHCVDYNKMPPELRAQIPALVNEVLTSGMDVQDAVDVSLKGVLG